MTRANKKRRRATFDKRILGGVAFTIIILAVALFYSSIHSSKTKIVAQAFQLKAAIIDQGSLAPTAGPDPVFVEAATNIMKKAGFTVDYYPGENVTVELYRDMATHGYGLVILRAHSTATYIGGIRGRVIVFTSEPYDKTKYVFEQAAGQICPVAYSEEEYKKGFMYFGIDARFVIGSMKESFQNTVVFMMGCQGLDNTAMAEAFVRKGAKVYISWSGSVLASHTDSSTANLLQHFLIEKLPLKSSVQETFKELGSDPLHESRLIYYPLEVGDKTIEDIMGP